MTTGKGRFENITSCAHTLLYIGRKLLFNCLQWNSLSSSLCRWPSPSKHVNPLHISMAPSMSTHFPSGYSGASQDFGCDEQYLQRLWIARAHQFLDICGHCFVMQYTEHLLEFICLHIYVFVEFQVHLWSFLIMLQLLFEWF
jgi:hypothetical protein